MTCRCVPAEPAFDNDRGAEEVVWRALREQLPDDAVLFHSVRLQVGPKQGEIDLLVAWPENGLAVIEVKGGTVTFAGGVWRQTGKALKSPAEQASDGRHLLHDYLKRRGCSFAQGRLAHLVAVPATRVPPGWAAPDCPRTMVVDHDDLPHAADVVRLALEEHGRNAPIRAAALDDLVDAVTAPLVGQQELLSLVWECEQQWDRFSTEQKRIATMLRQLRRIQVHGGAGSGKTFVAMHLAREHAKEGRRVALVCYSRGLARFFQRETATWPRRERPAYVGLFHQLAVDWGGPSGSDDDSDYWENRLPEALLSLAGAQPDGERFDSVVVDEGQDFGESWWPATEALLRHPPQGLYVFLDAAQRVFARSSEVPLGLETIDLDENFRNTKRIAQTFGSLTTGGRSRARGPEGPPVVFLPCASDDAQSLADDVVARLVDEKGWAVGDIALLSTRHRHPVHAEMVGAGRYDEYWDEFFAGTAVFYGHVLGFKGLERPVVVLAVDGFRDADRAKEMLYVGLSRARALLVVCGDLGEITRAGGEGVRRRLRAGASAI